MTITKAALLAAADAVDARTSPSEAAAKIDGITAITASCELLEVCEMHDVSVGVRHSWFRPEVAAAFRKAAETST